MHISLAGTRLTVRYGLVRLIRICTPRCRGPVGRRPKSYREPYRHGTRTHPRKTPRPPAFSPGGRWPGRFPATSARWLPGRAGRPAAAACAVSTPISPTTRRRPSRPAKHRTSGRPVRRLPHASATRSPKLYCRGSQPLVQRNICISWAAVKVRGRPVAFVECNALIPYRAA